ncbi:hypothetical protein PVAP13_4NG201411 [Panicum virgatum]|uniref:Uncharacterized protein n=1 Tax=Panicum virgatum TaxID=38727 RepID=A0A8T0TEC9_PANVG|nr:hypothetical protein PVAP13_4NG201411 [Panicum virgatum]
MRSASMIQSYPRQKFGSTSPLFSRYTRGGGGAPLGSGRRWRRPQASVGRRGARGEAGDGCGRRAGPGRQRYGRGRPRHGARGRGRVASGRRGARPRPAAARGTGPRAVSAAAAVGGPAAGSEGPVAARGTAVTRLRGGYGGVAGAWPGRCNGSGREQGRGRPGRVDE